MGGLPALATHIVGGELEMQYVGPNGRDFVNYQFNLNLYFDAQFGNPQAEDPVVTVFFFRKSDNALMGEAILPRTTTSMVNYTNPDCANSTLQTRFIRYGSEIGLNVRTFNDPSGYYVVWERCCRNSAINNIQDPGGAGSTFYLEFPAITRDGNNFVNSSPVFGLAKGDYICVNRPFTFDFGARDPDRDSLIYRLVTPYNGFSSRNNPSPQTATGSSSYPEVRWAAGIGLGQIIPGPQPLQVNPRTGLLTVTANRTGLYVFCVQVEEYRKDASGQYRRIGLVRRDFQLKVIECPSNAAPRLLMRQTGQAAFYREGSLVTLSRNDNKCFDLLITDRDGNQRIRLLPLGNQPGITLQNSEVFIRMPGDTARTQVCFDRCLAPPDGRTVTINLLAVDDGCPQGLEDTLQIRLQIEPDPNAVPDATTDLPNQRATAVVGKALSFNVFGNDLDRDQITLVAVGRGFTLAQAGMSFASVSGTGSVTQVFRWTPQCGQVRSNEYVIDFIVTDQRCNGSQRDTVTVRLAALPENSNKPEVRTTLPNPVIELTLNPEAPQEASVAFDAIANDKDPDVLKLSAQGRGFDWKSVGMQFQEKSGQGPLTSPFAWTPECRVMNGKSEARFEMDFLTEDNSCLPNRFDTTRVTIILKDRSSNFEITVPNVFTPNNDGKNDAFSVPELPQSTCSEQFERVEIYNRWGTKVYASTSRLFRWDGLGFPTGQYFYLIKYTRQAFRGPVTLLR